MNPKLRSDRSRLRTAHALKFYEHVSNELKTNPEPWSDLGELIEEPAVTPEIFSNFCDHAIGVITGRLSATRQERNHFIASGNSKSARAVLQAERVLEEFAERARHLHEGGNNDS